MRVASSKNLSLLSVLWKGGLDDIPGMRDASADERLVIVLDVNGERYAAEVVIGTMEAGWPRLVSFVGMFDSDGVIERAVLDPG